MIYLLVYITENCNTCARVVASAQSIVQKYASIELQVKNISKLNSRCKIVPAVYVNKKLFCYGEFETDKLLEQIKTP